jgi:Protein of unknown function (DUF2950)
MRWRKQVAGLAGVLLPGMPLVQERGIVYEADLGEDTLEAAAAAIESFDPGEGWTPVPAEGQ